MFTKLSLQKKLLLIGISLSVITMLIVMTVNLSQNQTISNIAKEECLNLAHADLEHIAQSLYSGLESQTVLFQEILNNSLSIAHEVLNRTGTINFPTNQNVTWKAINQYTKTTSDISLNKMFVGDIWLGQNSNSDEKSPVVDEVGKIANVTCTIFQRMNESGDMLRVCTNIKTLQGNRAIGTYIPRNNTDGTPSPVVTSVLNGETFTGRAFVVNAWYITAYEPIYDSNRNVIGMLYVGVPQDELFTIRNSIMNIKVGKTGYVYVLDSKGNYLISKNGERDGENIWDAKDTDGVYFIQEIVKKALALNPGDIEEQRYPWKNSNDVNPRMKIVKIMYFKPWDWIIGVGSYEDEFFEVEQKISSISQRINASLLLITCILLVSTALIWFFMSKGIVKALNKVIDGLSSGSDQVSSASSEISSSSQQLAGSASEQASSLEEVSSSLEEMTSMTKQNADNAKQADIMSGEAFEAAEKGTDAMTRMSDAIDKIKMSSDETAKIIKTIDEIAFQTNLLALNAAVEAARAGEAGMGFAVVAEEVRNLAQRSAEAAKNTASLIEESKANADNGVTANKEVVDILSKISQSVQKVKQLVSEVAAASEEQAQGINQVNMAISQMDQVTQTTAANAEESASASQELSSQATELSNMVTMLVSVVSGNNKDGNNLQMGKMAPIKNATRVSASSGAKKMHAQYSKKLLQNVFSKVVKPDNVIPLDDQEFDEF
ncbi:MAG: methyl-accepting chemotaxis protein [Candidatus Latescibacteria bacterium]|nr:methyl-accepting chemotaxis protein [Candidatus Latescibacterota bacterium]